MPILFLFTCFFQMFLFWKHFFLFIFCISVSSSVKRFNKPWTKPASSEMNHNITNSVLKKVLKKVRRVTSFAVLHASEQWLMSSFVVISFLGFWCSDKDYRFSMLYYYNIYYALAQSAPLIYINLTTDPHCQFSISCPIFEW